MAFDDRLAKLRSKVQEEYNDLVVNANFLEGDVEALSEKITVSRWLTTYISESMSDSPTDVEALLFYENPLAAAFEHFRENDTQLWEGLTEPINGFIQDTKQHIEEVMAMWNALPLNEMERAEVFLAMTKQIEHYLEQLEQGLDDDMER
ncbi:MAG: hypothetical protein RR728_00445 [Oscillospiraceae bacterium]